MLSTVILKNKTLKADLSRPIDISMPLGSKNSASAWYVSPVKTEVVRAGNFVGSVKEGGSVNFRNISFNPHGNGTHTECVGHISPEIHSVNRHLKTFFFDALLVSIQPEKITNNMRTSAVEDEVITKQQIEKAIGRNTPGALIIRTLPNHLAKTAKNYSNSNPAYLHHEAAAYISQRGIDHLLLDLPSVDREDDGGQLLAHKAFWQYPGNTQLHKTITELIFVPDPVIDGNYLLNLMIAPFENDASPSKPVLYPIGQ